MLMQAWHALSSLLYHILRICISPRDAHSPQEYSGSLREPAARHRYNVRPAVIISQAQPVIVIRRSSRVSKLPQARLRSLYHRISRNVWKIIAGSETDGRRSEKGLPGLWRFINQEQNGLDFRKTVYKNFLILQGVIHSQDTNSPYNT